MWCVIAKQYHLPSDETFAGHGPLHAACLRHWCTRKPVHILCPAGCASPINAPPVHVRDIPAGIGADEAGTAEGDVKWISAFAWKLSTRKRLNRQNGWDENDPEYAGLENFIPAAAAPDDSSDEDYVGPPHRAAIMRTYRSSYARMTTSVPPVCLAAADSFQWEESSSKAVGGCDSLRRRV